ncbi:MAG TPA: MBL fold metallo-hydrolase, partial [Bacteroidia bacterium]
MTNNNSISISFLGGAGTVTGSKTLLEKNGQRILIDCGLFQGLKVLRLLNWQPFQIDPSSVHSVIITHAHLDHLGYLPLLVKDGFNGIIYATPPTCDLARVILTDSAKLQEEEAYYANKAGYSKHTPAKPLYTIHDAEIALQHFVPVENDTLVSLPPEFSFRFLKSGHILGSAFAEITAAGKKIIFSGDLGRQQPILLDPPAKITTTDYLILESTYGNRIHPQNPTDLELAGIVDDTLQKKGNLIIPTFAVERAQEIMFILNSLRKKNMIPSSVPIYLDSPMGVDATKVFMKYPAWHKLNQEQCSQINTGIKMIKEIAETKNIIKEKNSKIIIAGSGMLSGGRVLEYLKAFAEDHSTTVLFVGFQAEGTRGKAMVRGGERIKIHGNYYNVNAQVKEISSFS